MKILAFALLLLSSTLFAQVTRPTGNGNGGQTVYSGGNAYLRDLVEKNNCTWKNYIQVLEEAPKLSKVLDKMYKLNSSFTLRIEEEMSGLGYCFTPHKLPALTYNNSDDIHIFPNGDYDQVAINDHGIVFVDINILEKMDDDNKAYLFLHEASHELFDPKEERSKKEPRLREFLMNVFEQVDHLVQSGNKDGFNYIIEQAKFGRLEKVIHFSEVDFEIVFSNRDDVSLARKIEALRSLSLTIDSVGYVFSKILKENIKIIENERNTNINEILTRTNYRTSFANFSNLVDSYTTISSYIYGDQSKIERLTDAIKYMLQTYDLSASPDKLAIAFKLINIEKTKEYYGGLIARNYDVLFGEGTFVTRLLLNKAYFSVMVFGTNYKMRKKQYYRFFCDFCAGYRYYYDGDLKLINGENGLLQDVTTPLSKYIMEEVKYNQILRKEIRAIITSDIKLLKSTSISKYTLPKDTIVGALLAKRHFNKGNTFSKAERNKEIKLRESLLGGLQ